MNYFALTFLHSDAHLKEGSTRSPSPPEQRWGHTTPNSTLYVCTFTSLLRGEGFSASRKAVTKRLKMLSLFLESVIVQRLPEMLKTALCTYTLFIIVAGKGCFLHRIDQTKNLHMRPHDPKQHSVRMHVVILVTGGGFFCLNKSCDKTTKNRYIINRIGHSTAPMENTQNSTLYVCTFHHCCRKIVFFLHRID